MDLLRSMLTGLRPAVPMTTAIVVVVAALFAAHRLFEKRVTASRQRGFQHQVTILVLTFLGLLLIIVVSPLSDAQKGQLLSLIGILLSAAIALSSTTFLGNVMAGIMLRVTRGFRIGDFVRVGDHFGRVSERGLFHTEIQTEDRDLMTLPNLYLVTHPVKVIRASGTIVSAEVSLGYDLSHKEIESLLCEAGKAAGLEEPFVHIMQLGDFSVTYRVSGLLAEVKQVISARSRLRQMILDRLHAGGVEIVSPSFMNTRAIAEGHRFIPRAARAAAAAEPEVSAEALAFDKAEEAESTEKLRERHEEVIGRLAECEKQLKEARTDEEKERLGKQIEQLKVVRDRIAALVQRKTDELED